MEKEEYQAALDIYRQMLKLNPHDAAAVEGARRAEEGLIGQRLITIRFMRLGQNRTEALEALRRLIADEDAWAVFPTGAVFVTQRDELAAAFEQFRTLIDEQLNLRHPVPARLAFEKFKGMFLQGSTFGAADELWRSIESQGKGSCGELAKKTGKDSVYFRGFVNRYCQYWSADNPLNSVPAQGRDMAQHYRSVRVTVEIGGLPPALEKIFEERLQEGLKSTPYHDPAGARVLEVGLTGKFSDSYQEYPARLQHDYMDKEAYTEYVRVQKSRQVPKQGQTISGSSGTAAVAYTTEHYSEEEPITRYRRVPKTFSYDAVKYNQDLAFVVNGMAKLGEDTILLSTEGREHKEDEAHDAEIPEIGLHRKAKAIVEPLGWLQSKAGELGSVFATKLDGAWVDHYCRSPQRATPGALAEAVHKCLQAGSGGKQDLVDSWFRSALGVPYSEVKDLFPRS